MEDLKSNPAARRGWWWVWGFAVVVVVVAVTIEPWGPGWSPVEPAFVATHDPARQGKIGARQCITCHAGIHENWKTSHHAMANRLMDVELDDPAFAPPRSWVVGKQAWTFSLAVGQPVISYRDAQVKVPQEHDPSGVIGFTPLRQYLLPFSHGRWQVASAAYDPVRGDWFDVFRNEERQRGEWGHWTGQGMNWNANCAYCHMTDFQKNLHPNPEIISYDSTWLAQGIECAQCHTGLEAHVAAGGASPPPKLSLAAWTQSCATCHARREDLTPKPFRPGDLLENHYRVSLPDTPNLYHVDGQVNDENFEYGSMLLNRMGGKAGIACGDCHEPHRAELRLPIENNALCMTCHSTGERGAVRIDGATAHSHHSPDSPGNRCVECHMPANTFMVRDVRRDHLFSSPDPVLTRELGVPNTCNGCHTDQSVDWAIEWSEKWYGQKLAEGRARARARVLAAYWKGTLGSYGRMLEMAETEEVIGWKAALTSLLGAWADREAVTTYLQGALRDPHPLVRSAAVRALRDVPAEAGRIARMVDDPVLLVRLDAAVAMPWESLRGKPVESELLDYFRVNADRPVGALWVASWDFQRGDREGGKRWLARAVELDPGSPGVYRDGAVLLSRAGDAGAALAMIEEGVRRHPHQASLQYSLGLALAEGGRLADAEAALRRAVALEPRQDRAWFNLALILDRAGRYQEALDAIEKALAVSPRNTDFLQAKASFLSKLGRQREAHELMRPR
jgi:predicted CXXCH cytochrome family protein